MVEHNQYRAPGSAALNLWVFAAEIPPRHTLEILVGLSAASAFGVGVLNKTASDLQMKPEYFLAFFRLRNDLAVIRILLRIKASLKQPRSKVLPARHPSVQPWCHC